MASKIPHGKKASHTLGHIAEDLAARHLGKQGFCIIARNYRYQRAEIDIIAQKEQLLVFVEVKARSNDQFGHPETFVSHKQRTLVHTAAEYYVTVHNWCHAIRFDIIAVLRCFDGQLYLNHFEDAF
mmetsp:Transcript_34017/g.78405  ORF Transcript_34017/g.78405 Transcript_34017/m.78405 type:complete len:126 (-) Transcript_34017:428-805(-)